MATRLRQLAAYVIILIVGVSLYAVADRIAYTKFPGQIGPDQWPKLIIIVMISVCLFEIGRKLLASPAVEQPASEVEGWEEEDEAGPPRTVFAAIAITVVYLLTLGIVGFVIGTLFYVAGLMWLGGTRRPGTVAVLSLGITAFFAFFFMKLIYVALPTGISPFSWVSFAVMKLLGV
ncbi:tripartite tricarboxylate transporter TctB family protein [Hansschlegelia beijingensis]|uniref:tripartite tricarboxylate transporter TctB family protein n=1 Tax=Hansschlegelia beijingensis TaxID=1133344 RepID=UPI00387F2D0D